MQTCKRVFWNRWNAFLSQDKNRSSLIIEKVLKAAKAREAARKARDTARGVKAIDSGHVEGLADCSSKNPEECMLFIVEGDSAGGRRLYTALIHPFLFTEGVFHKEMLTGKPKFRIKTRQSRGNLTINS